MRNLLRRNSHRNYVTNLGTIANLNRLIKVVPNSLNDCYWQCYKAIILRKARLREAIYSLIQRVIFNTICRGKAGSGASYK
jgi:hypothetical protein